MRRPTLAQRAAQGVVFRILDGLRAGRLVLSLPDGSARTFGREAAPRARLTVRDWGAFTRLALSGDIGLGEAYTAGELDSDDLVALLSLLIENEPHLAPRYRAFSLLGRAANRVGHLWRTNTRRGSRDNIRAHYNLSNELFASFLDESMTYSCALYRAPEDDLAAAQANKRRAVLEKARAAPGQHILEIGSGWGSFAIDAAKAGCRVTTITLSEEQLRLARERVRAAGLAERVSVELRDYRDLRGRFDRVVSIEMIEAVGHENLGAYFRKIDELLAPDGLAVIQAITIPCPRYESYRRGCDWIQKHIFPGAVVPSVAAIAQALTRETRLFIESLENIGIHYARTLRDWRRRFRAARARLEPLGFDATFARAWEYYLCYSEAGFATRTLGDVQLVLTRENNRSLPGPDSLPALGVGRPDGAGAVAA